MAKIHHLPQHIISKIAAGEVIERPAYAVKELLDNAIDAKADNISVEIEQSGLKKITIKDDGEGMSREDLILSFHPHTTSKIFHEDDLTAIKTLGFRGEALASIATIADLTIQSRTKNQVGGLEISSQYPDQVQPIGMPVGTIVTIQNLFHSVPVRKKFLSSSQTEFRHITEVVINFALSYPDIKFFFTHNHKTIFNLPKDQTLEQRIKQLLGADIFDNLLPVSISDDYLTISGYISNPKLTTKTTQKQFLFVNNRRIYDKLLSSTIKNVYSNLPDKNSYPIAILFLKLPYETVDVNIHPKKDQISFINEQLIHQLTTQAITTTLNTYNSNFFSGYVVTDHGHITDSYTGKILKDEMTSWDITNLYSPMTDYIQQIHNLYLLVPTAQGLMIIDQHAAHERILYEKLLTEFTQQKQSPKAQKLSPPIHFELPTTDSIVLQEYLSHFQQTGFDIEYFQKNTFILRTIPAILKDHHIKQFVIEMIDHILENKKIPDIDHLSRKIITYIACRSAIKSGDKINQDQAKQLIKELENTPNNLTCPHGRPTSIKINLQDLNKTFKR